MKTNPMIANRIHWIAYDRCGPGSADGSSSAFGAAAGAALTLLPAALVLLGRKAF